MIRKKRLISVVVGGAVLTGAIFVAVGSAAPGNPSLTNVPTANTKSDGFAPASKLSPELRQVVVAQGSTKLENTSALTSYYGYDNDTVNSAGEPVMVPTTTNPVEAHKTEPDKNTYLTFKHGLSGADPNYDYGSHFLFQGHEGGAGGAGYITRINLDADAAHRVTLLATQDANGNPITTINASSSPRRTPPRRRMQRPRACRQPSPTSPARSAAAATKGSRTTTAATSGSPRTSADRTSRRLDLPPALMAIRPRPHDGEKAKQLPLRYVPAHKGDLANGKLQVLQVLNAANQPITFESEAALNNADQVALHTYGNTFQTRWVTIHDTAMDGTTPFNANTLAKTPLPSHNGNVGTPFKRPENGVFRPGSDFKQFFFDETGDTNATSPENDTAGGWGSIMKLSQSGPGADTGRLSLFYKPDGAHSSLDNVTFLSKDIVTFGQDMGDGLHTQLNALDSAFTWDVTRDYSDPANLPVRWLAEGRDASATLDGSATPTGFGKNDGDNETTGIHVSDGDSGVDGILGNEVPDLSEGQWRWFYTQQHGDNPTYEVLVRHNKEKDGH